MKIHNSLPFILAVALCWLVVPQVLPAQGIVLNEFMAANAATLTDEDGDTPDWIELHNPGAESVNLAGYGLSDNPDRPFKWVFGDVSVEPGGFLVVFASGKNRNFTAPTPPDLLPGLQLWLDAAAINADDPAQVQVVGGAPRVAQWRDRTGAGHHANQAGASARPLLLPATVERPAAVRFDGLNDYLEIPYSLPLNAGDMTILLVVRKLGGSDAQTALSSRDYLPTAPPAEQLAGYVFYVQPDNRWSFWTGSGSKWTVLDAPGVIALEQPYLLAASFDLGGSTFWEAGVPVGRSHSWVNVNRARALRVGAGVNESAPGRFLEGEVADVVVYDRRLSDSSSPIRARVSAGVNTGVTHWRAMS